MSYVYICSERPGQYGDNTGLWTVGFYKPGGLWEPESDHDSTEKAASRVAYLNGRKLPADERCHEHRDDHLRDSPSCLLEQERDAIRERSEP